MRERETYRVVDLNGERAVIAVGHCDESIDPALTKEARAVFDSIVFVPTNEAREADMWTSNRRSRHPRARNRRAAVALLACIGLAACTAAEPVPRIDRGG